MKKSYLIVLVIIFIQNINAQPEIEWKKCFGGSHYEGANSIQQTTDGGYIVAGNSYSNDGDVSENHGGYDSWIIKLNSDGDTIWTKVFGGSQKDNVRSIQQTMEGNYIVAGYSHSNDGDVSGNHGTRDCWVLKLNSIGDTIWTKCLGGGSWDMAFSTQQTSDSNFIIAGYASSNNGDVSGNHGQEDYWIVKLNSEGDTLWTKCYGGSGHDIAQAITETTDNMLVVAGITTSNDGDVSGHQGMGYDYWIIKLNMDGDIIWKKCYGGNDGDYANSIQQTTDGGYIVAGSTTSNDGDVSGNHGGFDYWILKLDSDGDTLWTKCYGGSGDDLANSIQQTTDSGFIVAGRTTSSDGDVWGSDIINDSIYDYWILKLNSDGDILWTKCFGGSNEDKAFSIQQTIDGGYIVAGQSNSNDGDVEGNHGYGDYWIVKLLLFTSIEENTGDNELKIYPNPAKNRLNIITNNNTIIENVFVYNLSGHKLISTKPIDNTIDIRELQTGIYIIEVVTNHLKTRRKLVIK